MRMLGAAPLATLLRYHHKTGRCAQRFGLRSWPTIYQADMVARTEHMENVRRDIRDGVWHVAVSMADTLAAWALAFTSFARREPFEFWPENLSGNTV